MTCPRCQARGKTWNGDDPKCAFENEHAFSEDNWNCATANAIRDLFDGEWELPFSFSRRYEDQNEASVSVADIDLETCSADTLWIGWYKRRGRVEQMWLLGDGDPCRPSLGDCEAILQHFGALVAQE